MLRAVDARPAPSRRLPLTGMATWDAPDRDEWVEAVTAAVLAVAANLRDRIRARVEAFGGTIPTDATVLYQQDWWQEALDRDIGPATRNVAERAADQFADVASVDLTASERDAIADAVVVAITALLLNRGAVIGDRVAELVDRGIADDWDAERFAAELGVDDGDESGPMSTAVMAEIGAAAALAAGYTAADRVAQSKNVTGTKSWLSRRDERVRPTHAEADETYSSDPIPVGEPFTVGGFPAMTPHSPELPVQEVAGCRCRVVYELDAAARADVDDGVGLAASAVLAHSHTDGGLRLKEPEVTAVSDTMQEMPPVDGAEAMLGDIPDDELIAEIARRAAERAAAASDDAGPVDADEAEAVVAEHIAEAVDDLTAEAADDVDEVDEADETADGDATPPVDDAPDADMATDTTALRIGATSLRLFDDATVTYALIGDTDLPVADPDRAWDGDEAATRVVDWATDGDTIDPARMSRAFLWRDDDAPDTNIGSYRLGFADIIDDELTIVPRGVYAVASVLGGGRGGVDLPEADQDRVRGRVNSLYERIADATGDDSIEAPFAVATVDMGTEFAVEGIPDRPAVTDYDGEGILCVEGIMTGDGRMMAEDSLTWRHLPVPFAFLEKITEYHQEGEFCGCFHRIERRGNAIWGWFTLEDNPAGNRLRAILSNPKGAGRYGVSVDIDAATVVYSDPDGNVMDMIDAQDAAYAGEDVVQLLIEGRIIGATGVMHPALQEANVWLIDTEPEPSEAIAASIGGRLWRSTYGPDPLRLAGADDVDVLVASAGTVTDVPAPPARYFDLPPMDAPVAFDVHAPDADGVTRCFGLVAEWGDCHLGFEDRCVTVPRSPDFEHFYGADEWRRFYGGPALSRFYAGNKKVLCRDGSLVQVGPVIVDTVHPNLRMRASDAQAFYADTGCAVADVRLYVNEFGIVAAGVIRPDADPLTVARLRASDVSPDWRLVDGQLKILALLAVNVSAFQIQGLAASAGQFRPWAAFDEASGEATALVAAGALHKPRRSAMVEMLSGEVDRLSGELAALSDAYVVLAERVDRTCGPIEMAAMAKARRVLQLD